MQSLKYCLLNLGKVDHREVMPRLLQQTITEGLAAMSLRQAQLFGYLIL
jgi:hypothetical protein